ncbi:MAG: hypothetical protein COX40_02465 [Candidatus Omnitrophica bacterium CG23_combo_of_CG06-09_8_20_14_all_40_11]|nr:MAG: hypothetical protein COX40_02465 [Candidatus Omnitrophica bacterium CG23_combo_of_CG06-09_8_20_14_all_40_11]
MNMEERRRFVRWQVNRQASVKLRDQDNPFDCKIKDIGLKGLRIYSPQELKKDSNLALSIALGYELSLNIEASVAWNKAVGADNICGLYFTRIRDIDKEKIYEFVRKNFPEQIEQQLWKGVV